MALVGWLIWLAYCNAQSATVTTPPAGLGHRSTEGITRGRKYSLKGQKLLNDEHCRTLNSKYGKAVTQLR